MPDWFYRTIARPVLFRMPVRTSRSLALGLLRNVVRIPGGKHVVDFLGHMRPDAKLSKEIHGLKFPSPIGLGPALDEKGSGLKALERFGVGFIEYGPVALENNKGIMVRRREQQAIWVSEPAPSQNVETASRRLRHIHPLSIPLLVRVTSLPWSTPEETTLEVQQVLNKLSPFADGFILMTGQAAANSGWSDESWSMHLQTISSSYHHAGNTQPLFISLTADTPAQEASRLLAPIEEWGYSGIVIDSSISAGSTGRLLGQPAQAASFHLLEYLRAELGPLPCILVSGAVHQPEEAMDLLAAGADLLSTVTGIIYSGPGLPKRCNEAILGRILEEEARSETETIRDADLQTQVLGIPLRRKTDREPPRPASQSWFWLMLMGLGLAVGGIVALGIASTRVLLPYDEIFSEITRAQLHEVNPKLLHFMAHDRVSLAGTMLATGFLYVAFASFGIRFGEHWARVTVLSSAWVGFVSFLGFLGFGYFDPFHAFATSILFQFLIMGCFAATVRPSPRFKQVERETPAWRKAQWGQLLLLLHSAGLMSGGIVITVLGCTSVLVQEDLHFLELTSHQLEVLKGGYPRLLPLIAHDRATFGSMLFVLGLTSLLASLWGIRSNTRWLWWSMLLAGVMAYLPSWIVHEWVGYTDWFHLLPLTGGLVLLFLGLALTYRYQTSLLLHDSIPRSW